MGIFSKFFGKFKKSEINEKFYSELTELLILSDMGVILSEEIIDELRLKVRKKGIKNISDAKNILREILLKNLPQNDIKFNYPIVITVIGVNGVGKTTTIAKMANYFLLQKKSVLLAAGDTFRAAACEQLGKWAEKLKVRLISQGIGADPASVVFDAIESAKAKDTDVLIVDTAGRLHTKLNLMAELKKINTIIINKYPQAKHYNFIVLDASIGQNSISQVKAFRESVDIDGIILTKLDGTAKGGIVFPILQELDIPIPFICFGEKLADIAPFDAQKFVDNIL